MKKKLNSLIIFSVVLVALYGLTACGLQQLIYPGAGMEMPDSRHGSPEARVEIPAQDGTTLRGWFFNRGANSPLVVFYGGNAMNVGGFINFATSDTSRSYLLINYRGYGGSEGKPTEKALVNDAQHCLRWARTQLGSPASVTLAGFSLGSGVATQVAAAEKPTALILICPFDSITEVACNLVPVLPRFLPLDSWKSADFAHSITCPVTILRATNDSIVPPASTDALIRAFTATTPTVISFPADHNDIFTAPGFDEALQKALP